MISKIKQGIYVNAGTYVANTGKSTIQFPSKNSASYLMLCGDVAFSICITDATTLSVVTLSNGRPDLTVTANGDYNFTLDGLPWWQNPYIYGLGL